SISKYKIRIVPRESATVPRGGSPALASGLISGDVASESVNHLRNAFATRQQGGFGQIRKLVRINPYRSDVVIRAESGGRIAKPRGARRRSADSGFAHGSPPPSEWESQPSSCQYCSERYGRI